MYKLSDYSNDVQVISAKWLFDELQVLRSLGTISDRTKRYWKNLAGVPNETGVRLRKITPNQAARIVFLALWDEMIKPEIRSTLKAKDFENALLFTKAFNQWIAIDGGGQAASVLRVIRSTDKFKAQDVRRACEVVTKKRIPVSTFRRWLSLINQSYRVDQIYDPETVAAIINLAKNRGKI